MFKNTVAMFFIMGTLIVSTIGFGVWGLQQTLKIASLAAELTLSAKELAKQKALHASELKKQKAQLKAKAKLQRSIAVLPFVGAGLLVYFEERDYNEWLAENPTGDRIKYACDFATQTNDIVDQMINDVLDTTKNLPDYAKPNKENVAKWLKIPKCE